MYIQSEHALAHLYTLLSRHREKIESSNEMYSSPYSIPIYKLYNEISLIFPFKDIWNKDY